MKTVFLFFFLILAMAGVASANTVVSLPGRKVSLGGSGDLPTMIDLSSEIRKKDSKISLESSQLIQLDLVSKAGPTGAIYALMMNSAAVDSETVSDDRETSISLLPDSEITPNPWTLGIRGDVDIKEIRVTLNTSGQRQPPPAQPTPLSPLPSPSQPPPVIPDPVPRIDDDLIHRRVLVVSRTTGRIDYVVVQGLEMDGSYRVLFQGIEYNGFERHQIALLDGCIQEKCVGDIISYQGERARLLGRLPNDQWVIETTRGARLVISQPPQSVVRSEPRHTERLTLQDLVPREQLYWVSENSDALLVEVMRATTEGAWIRPPGSQVNSVKVMDVDSLARPRGCRNELCVGDFVTATDENGRPWNAQVIAFQNKDYVVVRLLEGGWMIGHWPLESLQKAASQRNAF